MASSWAMPLSDLGRNCDQFDDHYNYVEHGGDDDDDDKNALGSIPHQSGAIILPPFVC